MDWNNLSNPTLKFEFTLTTDGQGLWSNKIKEVKTTHIECWFDRKDPEFGELRVYFDTNTWNIQEDGLIYTDDQFLDELRGCLEVLELNDEDIGYSEQGMQGDDYVSLDVGDKFLNSWLFKEWAECELAGR